MLEQNRGKQRKSKEIVVNCSNIALIGNSVCKPQIQYVNQERRGISMKINPLIGDTVQEVISGETRVVLVGTRYKPEASEPVWGSAYECPGTVIEICGAQSEYDVRIEWDNDHTNAYQIEDLCALRPRRSNNPNYHFRIWKRKNERQKPKQNV